MKVTIVGATGETGQSIVKGLLESSTAFDITALAREASIGNTKNQALKDAGVKVVAADLKGPEDELVRILGDTEVVISAIGPFAFDDQIPLANAAKKAGVQRFVPCSFATAAPPTGVMALREKKEAILNHIKTLYLPFTVIDVGWWFQITPPRLPSGRLDHALTMPSSGIVGDHGHPSALTDLRDIGRWVARIIADPRTLNRLVFAYSEVITQHQVYETVERLSGEKPENNPISDAEVAARVEEAKKALQSKPEDPYAAMGLWSAEYLSSWGVRGDNTPEHARYLGYLDGKELYPDLKLISFETYVTELLEGKGKKVYA